MRNGNKRRKKGVRRMVSGMLAAALLSMAVLAGVPVQVAAAPETVAGGYEIDMEQVPMVHFSKHKNWETLYRTAWESHKSNITPVSEGLNPELTGNGVQSYYVDEAFDDRIFQWDTLFMMLFDKYGIHEFPTLNSMDNFYYHQWDTDDDSNGYISRMIWQGDGSSYYTDYRTVDAINPPLFAWAEWEQYKVHGDVSRFTKVIRGKTIIERMDSYYQFLKRTRTHQTGPAKGLYVSNGQGNGLDNTPNQDRSGWGQAANDMSLQQVQAAGYISKIAGEILKKNGELTQEERQKYTALKEKYEQEESDLKSLIQEKLWSEEGGFFFNIDSQTGEFTNIATPTGLWALAAGVATQEQADRMIREYARNSNKMFRPNGLSTVCYDYQTFKPAGGYWNGAMWSPTSYQWLKGLQQYGYDDLAFEEAVRHINALADVCVNGAYDRNGNFLETLWENYSSEYSLPGSTEYADTEPSRSNFVGWTGALGIAAVLEDIAGITVDAPENTVNWNIKLTEEFGVDQLYLKGPEGDNFISLSSAERVSRNSGAVLFMKADHDFSLHVTIGEQEEVIQAKAGEHTYTIAGTDGQKSYLGLKTTKAADTVFGPEQTEQAESAVWFGESADSSVTDGLSNQIQTGGGEIFNVNTVGYPPTDTAYPTVLRDSRILQEYGVAGAKEYVKTTSPSGAEGFLFQVPASNSMRTVKALIGVKNGTAKLEADLLDASETTLEAELTGRNREEVYAVEIPYCAASDTDLMITVTMPQGEKPGELSLKAILLENGGSQVLAAPVGVTADTEDGALIVNASAPEGVGYDGYRIYYKETGESRYQVKETKTFPCRLENLENYKRYDLFVTGMKDGAESSCSADISQIPEQEKRSDTQRAYSDWLKVQKQVLNGNADFAHVVKDLNFEAADTVYGTEFVFSSDGSTSKYGLKNDGSVVSPVLPQKDAENILYVEASCGAETIQITVPVTVTALAAEQVPYVSGVKGELTAGTIHLTEEGTGDWVQFHTSDIRDYVKKDQETAKLKNFAVLDSVDGKVSDAAFAFTATDGTGQPEDYTAISARGLYDGFTFELPYSEKVQKAKIYANVWGGDVTLEILVNDTVLYTGTFGKDTSSGMLGQDFEITYRVPSKEDKVTAKLYCTSDLGEWGGCVTALQAVTVKETEERIPTPEPEDTRIVMEQYAQPEKVDLTREGTADWKLFTAVDLEQIEKKAGGQGIQNLSAVMSVTKQNENASDAEFTYTDGTISESGRFGKGIVFEQAGNGIQFDLPYSMQQQTARIYFGAWSAKVKISASVIKNGQTIKTCEDYFDTGAQQGGAPARYGAVSIRYLLDDADTALHVEVKNDELYDTTWGNMNLGAVTLNHSLLVSAEETEHGALIITNPIAAPGDKVTVLAAADEGYRLAEGSLRYYRAGDPDGTQIEGESFRMPSECVTVKAEFTKDGGQDDSGKQMMKAMLEHIYNLYIALDTGGYTRESAEALSRALEDAERVLHQEETDGTQEMQAAENIIKAAAGLVFDTTELERAAEEAQKRAEEAQKRAEDAQKQAEDAQKQAEEAKKNAENAQKQAEEAKKNAEDAQKRAEEAAKREEDAQKSAEAAKKQAEDAQKRADEAQKQANDAKKQAEDAQKRADDAQKSAEDAQKRAEDAQKSAEDAQKRADEAQKREGDAQKRADLAEKAAGEAKAAAQKAAQEAKAAAEKAVQEALAAARKDTEADIAEGQSYDSGNYTYKITDVKKQTAEVTGVRDQSLTGISVPDSILLGQKRFQVTSIAASAFKGNKNVTEAVIGKNVKSVKSSAFAGCTKLKTVLVKGKKLGRIGSRAFSNCKKLEQITLQSKSLKKVGKNAFKGICKTAVIRVPAAKYHTYKKLLAKGGQSSTVKIKK